MTSALLAMLTIAAGGLIRLASNANPRNPAMTFEGRSLKEIYNETYGLRE
jgi:hypothetical protein